MLLTLKAILRFPQDSGEYEIHRHCNTENLDDEAHADSCASWLLWRKTRRRTNAALVGIRTHAEIIVSVLTWNRIHRTPFGWLDCTPKL